MQISDLCYLFVLCLYLCSYAAMCFLCSISISISKETPYIIIHSCFVYFRKAPTGISYSHTLSFHDFISYHFITFLKVHHLFILFHFTLFLQIVHIIIGHIVSYQIIS